MEAERRPLVLEDISTSGFVHYIIDRQAESATLIICSTREAFLQELLFNLENWPSQDDVHAFPEAQDQDGQNQDQDNAYSANDQTSKSPGPQSRAPYPLLQPTLRLLSATRTISLAFCPDTPHLLAYLSNFSHSSSLAQDPRLPVPAPILDGAPAACKAPILAILNPIRLHRPTSAFSAQGLNRAFAAAVDAAFVTGRWLVVAECCHAQVETSGDAMAEERGHGQLDQAEQVVAAGPWDEQVAILNVTTKSFGAGERGWVGRTVAIRRVAGRWFRFERAQPRTRDGGDEGSCE